VDERRQRHRRGGRVLRRADDLHRAGRADARAGKRRLLANQTVGGVTAALDTFIPARSIAYGLMVSTIVLPRRAPSGGAA
jgi:hypothetical protein